MHFIFGRTLGAEIQDSDYHFRNHVNKSWIRGPPNTVFLSKQQAKPSAILGWLPGQSHSVCSVGWTLCSGQWAVYHEQWQGAGTHSNGFLLPPLIWPAPLLLPVTPFQQDALNVYYQQHWNGVTNTKPSFRHWDFHQLLSPVFLSALKNRLIV